VHDKTALITGTAILLGRLRLVLGVVALRSWRRPRRDRPVRGRGVAAAVTRHDAGVQPRCGRWSVPRWPCRCCATC
jgi:hypothetical protein